MQRAGLLAVLSWAAAVAPAAASRHLEAKVQYASAAKKRFLTDMASAPAEGAQVGKAEPRELATTVEEVRGAVTPAASASHPRDSTLPQPTGPAPPRGEPIGHAHTAPADGSGVATYFKHLLGSTVEEVRSAGRELWRWGAQPNQKGKAAPASEGKLDEVKEAAPTAPAVASAPFEASPAPLAHSEKPAPSSKTVTVSEEEVKQVARLPQPKEGAAAPAVSTPLDAIPAPTAGSENPVASAGGLKGVAELRARLTEVSKGLEAMVAPTGPLSHMDEASKLRALAKELDHVVEETSTVDDSSSAADVNLAVQVLKIGMDDVQSAKLALSHRMRELKTEEDVEVDAAREATRLRQVEKEGGAAPKALAASSTPREASPASLANVEKTAPNSKPAGASEEELGEVAELRAALAKVSKGLTALVAPASPLSRMEGVSNLTGLTKELDRVLRETSTIDDATSAAAVRLAVKRLKASVESVQSAKQALSHRMEEIKTEADAEENAVREAAKEEREAAPAALAASSTPREASTAQLAHPEKRAPSSKPAGASADLADIAGLRARLAKVSKGLEALAGSLSHTEQASKLSGLTKELDHALKETASIGNASSAADVESAVKRLKAGVEDVQRISQGVSRRLQDIKADEGEASVAPRASSGAAAPSVADASAEDAVQEVKEAAPTAPAAASAPLAASPVPLANPEMAALYSETAVASGHEVKEVATPLLPHKESEPDSPAPLAASEETAQSGTPAASSEEAVMQVAKLRAKMIKMSTDLETLKAPTSPLSHAASTLLSGISEALHDALQATADVDRHSSAVDVQQALVRLKSGMEDVQSLDQALSTRMEQLKTEQDLADASYAVSDRMEQLRTALSGKPAAATEDVAKLPQPKKEAEAVVESTEGVAKPPQPKKEAKAASPAPAAASEWTVQSGTPAVASKEAVMQVAQLSAKLAKVSQGLSSLVAGALAKTELAKPLSVITEAIDRSLKETGTIDGNSSVADVQQAMELLKAVTKDVQTAKAAIASRQSQLEDEGQVQDSSLLVGVLMDHRNDPWSRQVEVLLDPAFASLPAVQKVLATQDKSTPLYKQVAAALDSTSKEADTSSAEGNLTASAPAKPEKLVAFTQLVHQAANSACPYCSAQCLEKCHVQEKKDYSVCIVDCDSKQR